MKPASAGLVLVNWLVPGAGFCVCGRWARGATQAALVLATMGLGWGLHAGVNWPSWSPAAADFNVINNLSFIVQLGAGLPALLSLAAAEQGVLGVIGGIPSHAYYELGGYYLIVAGAVNYFATMNFYDRMVRGEGRLWRQEAGEEEPAGNPEEPGAEKGEAG